MGTVKTATAIVALGEGHQIDRALLHSSQRLLSDFRLAGLPVLPGFVVTGQAYADFYQENQLDRFVTKALLDIDWSHSRSAALASRAIEKKIKASPLPRSLREELEAVWQQLGQLSGMNDFLVQPALLDGQATSSLEVNWPAWPVRSVAQLEQVIKQAYATLFDSQNLLPATVEDLYSLRYGLSFTVQPLPGVSHSGRLQTDDLITIEAVFGRPEPLVEQLLTPDRYTVDPHSVSIVSRDINRQEWQLLHLDKGAKHQKISSLNQTSQKLDDDQILEVAKLGLMVTHQTDFPCQLTWIIDGHDQLWLTEVEQLGKVDSEATYQTPTTAPVIRGRPVVAGTVTGPLRIFHQLTAETTLQPGEVVAVEQLDQLPESLLANLGGLVVESGQLTDSFIELVRDHGIPTVQAAKGLLQQLSDGQLVTLDGRTGAIYRGKLRPGTEALAGQVTTGVKLLTAPTTLEETVDQVEAADGLGLLSASLLLSEELQQPRARGSQAARWLQHLLVDEFCHLAQAWQPKPIIYAAHDWHSSDELEKNPMLGYRGAARALNELDLFKAELEALRQVREEYNYTNLHLMIPFVRTLKELTALHHLVVGSGLRPGPHFKLWLHAGVPSNLLSLKKIISHGLVQGVCLDADSLTQLLLGVDQANEKLTATYDVCDEAVLEALVKAVKTVKVAGLAVTVSGQSLNHHPEAIEALVEAGVTGLIIEPASLQSTHHLIASAEQRLLLDHLIS